MHKRMLFGAIFLASLLALPISLAHAQNARSWVASAPSGGSDANPCTLAQPCATFSHALTQTNAGGEINCVNDGEFGGQIMIKKSVTIDCEGVQAGITGPGFNSFAVEVLAAATDVVVLRGLDISGNGVGVIGIAFYSGAKLHVEKCVIRDLVNDVSFGIGIQFEAAVFDSSVMELYVTDTIVTDNNAATNSVGILVSPTAPNTINKVILNRVEARKNFFGIKADGTQASGGVINMTVRDSVASGNSANGIVATSNATGAAVVMMVDHSAASHNGAGYGVIADGPKTTVEMSRSTASGNNFGIGATNSATLLSYQNNEVTNNSTDGSPTGVVAFK